MQFIFVLPGWEGSAADGRVLRDALHRPNGLKVAKPGVESINQGTTSAYQGATSAYQGATNAYQGATSANQGRTSDYPELSLIFGKDRAQGKKSKLCTEMEDEANNVNIMLIMMRFLMIRMYL
ncbi:hypothetical protein Tco_0480531 [Tanacetum coccineum]